MSKDPIGTLQANEVAAINILRADLPNMAKQLVRLSRHPSAAQARQAIELAFKFALADRQQQFDANGEPVGGSGNTYNILNKIDVKMVEVMQNMDLETRAQFAELLEKLETQANELELDIIEGEIAGEIEAVGIGNPCKCGCGENAKPGRDWIHGHHLRAKGGIVDRKPPQYYMERRKKLEAVKGKKARKKQAD